MEFRGRSLELRVEDSGGGEKHAHDDGSGPSPGLWLSCGVGPGTHDGDATCLRCVRCTDEDVRGDEGEHQGTDGDCGATSAAAPSSRGGGGARRGGGDRCAPRLRWRWSRCCCASKPGQLAWGSPQVGQPAGPASTSPPSSSGATSSGCATSPPLPPPTTPPTISSFSNAAVVVASPCHRRGAGDPTPQETFLDAR